MGSGGPRDTSDLSMMIGRIDERTLAIQRAISDLNENGCKRWQEHSGRDPDRTSNGNGSMKASLFKGFFTFEGRGKAARVLAVSVAVAVMVFTAGYVHTQFQSLKSGIGQQVKSAVAKELAKTW